MPSLSGNGWYAKAARQGAFIRQSNFNAKTLNQLNKELGSEIEQIIKKLEKLPKEFHSKATKKALRPGANLIRDTAKTNAPVDGTNKYTSGEGGVNLKESIKTFSLRKSKKSLFVGPKMPRSARTGKVVIGWPYYAHWQEFGTRHQSGSGYMRRAYDTQKGPALELIKKGVEKVLLNWQQKNKV